MNAREYRDRLDRVDARAATLLGDLRHLPEEHVALVRGAWEEARKQQPPESETTAATAYVARIDAVLCLLERLLRPSTWLHEWAIWFDRLRLCLFDAVAHVTEVLGEAPIAAPMVAIEPIESPLYFPRVAGRTSWMPLATPADLPLPVVVCPGNHLQEPWEWSSLLHELGHHLDAALDDSEPLADALIQHKDLDTVWTDWVRECVADLYAGVLGGQEAIDAIGRSFVGKLGGSSSHPPDLERVAVLRAAWGQLIGIPHDPETRASAIVAPLLAQAFGRWQELVRKERKFSPRLLPGHLATMRAKGSDPQDLRLECEEKLSGFTPRAWQTRPALIATLAQAMRNLVETSVLPGGSFWKVPPIPLLVRHEKISLVGATHGQLLVQLGEALRTREGRPHGCIELFALDDEPLGRLLVGKKSGDQAVSERDKSMRDLAVYLVANSVPFAIYLYRDPYFFASYWDAEDNETRPRSAPPAHIHVSHAVWGGELRSAPSDDYEAPAGERLPVRMRKLVDALGELRRSSRIFALPPSQPGFGEDSN